MPTDTLERFREKKRQLGGAAVSERKKRLEQLQEDLRAATEELRNALETDIANALALADAAAGVWEAAWKAAVGVGAVNRGAEGQTLRGVLEDSGEAIGEAPRRAHGQAHWFDPPLARLDELDARVHDFPSWARECLARWDLLGRRAAALDPERVARARAAYARGEHEALDDVLSRVEAGGPWVKE